MLSAGNFRPSYYAFFDDNVIYDRQYAGFTSKGPQNDIHHRIKNTTQYFEGLTLFESVEDTLQDSGGTIYDGTGAPGPAASEEPELTNEDLFWDL